MAREASAEVAYAPWSTFNTALDTLRAHGLPEYLDRSVFHTQSGGTQAVLMATFKAIGALDENNKVQPLMHRLVDPAQRKAALREIADSRYSEVLGLGPAATPQQFDQVFRDYGLSGATHRKAKAFFLKLAEELGIKLSSYIMRGTTSGNGSPPIPTRKVRRIKRNLGGSGSGENPPPPPPPPSDTVLFHPAVDAFLREARKLTEGDTWTAEARANVIQGFTTQLDLFLPVKKARSARKDSGVDEGVGEA